MTALIVSHGHPRFNKGGAEIAAYRLYQALRNSKGWENSAFLAACPDDGMLKPGCELHGLSNSEWLVRRSTDPLLHDTNLNLTRTEHGFLYHALKDLHPTVIHIHHYVHIGLDLVHALKRWFPRAKVIFTLHEYWGMCPYEGRLLKRNGKFCNGPEPDACASCVGGKEIRIKLAVRRLRIQHFFSVIDQLISPSHFLKNRYVNWGFASESIAVVENLPVASFESSATSDCHHVVSKDSIPPLIFAYFGQINRWKGIDLILEAFSLALTKHPTIQLELHGLSRESLFEDQNFHDPIFLTTCRELIKKLPPESVRLMGAYEPQETAARLKRVDILIMASRWYENAPMVIQEAFSNGVPVIAPNYGGMAEKIKHKVTGLLYGSPGIDILADSLLWIAEDSGLLKEMSHNAKKNALSVDSVFEEHIALYEK